MSAEGGGAGRARPRILVVEDEFLIALDVEDALVEFGCDILGPAATVAEALRLIASAPPHAAILDVRLADGSTAGIAEALRERAVPFMIVTGYERWQVGEPVLRDAPMLAKPVQRAALRRLLHRLLGDWSGVGAERA